MVQNRPRNRIEVFADPTPERLKQSADWTVGNARDRRDRTVTVLDHFGAACKRGTFNQAQEIAGQHFHSAWDAIKGDLRSASLEVGTFTNGHFDLLARTEREMALRTEYRAVEKLVGVYNATVLRWFVCEGWSLQDVGKALGWKNKQQGIPASTERIRAILDRLCEFWGIGGKK